MDINFIADPADAPQPRQKVQVRSIRATPYPDGKRVWIEADLTPFMPMDRPNLEITVTNAANETEIAAMTVIESHTPSITVTVHLRGDNTEGNYIAHAGLFYEPGTIQHRLSIPFLVKQDSSQPPDSITNEEERG